MNAPVLLHRYARPSSIEAALQLLAADTQAAPLAGGTELVPLTRARLRSASTLVDLGRLPLAGVRREGDRLVLGALTTAQEAAGHPLVQAHAPLVAQALRAGASAQVRQRATLAGNLLQAPRCPWFRSGAPGCNRRAPGSGCDAQAAAQAGAAEAERWLAPFGGQAQCAAAAPSDLAVALQALRAQVLLRSLHGTRRLPLEALWCDGDQRPGVPGAPALAPGELITALEVLVPPGATALSQFDKVRERASFEFALVSVAVQLQLDAQQRIADAAVSAGGVAPTPWRLQAVEAALRGQRWPTLQPAAIAAHTFDATATPAARGPKPRLLARSLERALITLRRTA
ncbi:FAD binding domain-containing protein [Aquabacterium sp.]|uniref:FAD binding domain-containing protein n=1 Tax=Aquabacterium sp. TaxID=1872578 RepID=UPI0037835A3A